MGGSLGVAVDYMLGLTGADVPPEEVGRRMLDGMHERLSESVPLMPGAGRSELIDAMKGHVIGAAILTGTYERNENWYDFGGDWEDSEDID